VLSRAFFVPAAEGSANPLMAVKNKRAKTPIRKPGPSQEQRRLGRQRLLFAVLAVIIIITWIVSSVVTL